MKKFFKFVSAVSAIVVSVFGILALIDKIKNRRSDVIYFDCPEDEKTENK